MRTAKGAAAMHAELGKDRLADFAVDHRDRQRRALFAALMTDSSGPSPMTVAVSCSRAAGGLNRCALSEQLRARRFSRLKD